MPEMISIVVPCLNEQEVLRDTNRRLVAVLEQLPQRFEILYVDDGSTDSNSRNPAGIAGRRRANSRVAVFAQLRAPDGDHRGTGTRLGRRRGDH